MNQRRTLPTQHADPLKTYRAGATDDHARLTVEELRAQAARFIEGRRARGIPSGADRVNLEALKNGRPGVKEWGSE